MNDKQIECFLETGKHLSFTKAAQNLYLPQPAVSRYIAALEQELGVTLFVRENSRNISLSDEGIKELSTYWKDKEKLLRPYPECAFSPCCEKRCNYECRLLAREIARRLFKNVPQNTMDSEPIKKIFSQFTNLLQSELNDEPYSQELKICTKMHFWRKIKYETQLKVTEKAIEQSMLK